MAGDSTPPTTAELQQAIRRLRIGVVLSLVAAAAAIALVVLRGAASPSLPEVPRVRGLVVEDAEGRARILLGAPVPDVPERVRTDRERVMASWAESYGGTMDWYFENVDHRAFGLLVLDENGHDRIALGSPTPDPVTGARIEPSHGIAINDAEGIEVGGFGHFDERGQTGLGLDNPSGEGLYLLAASNGTSGVMVNDHGGARRLFLGLATSGSGLSPRGDTLGASITDLEAGRWWVATAGAGFEEVGPEGAEGAHGPAGADEAGSTGDAGGSGAAEGAAEGSVGTD